MENKVVIYIAGDSTAETKLHFEKPMSGWGEHLHDYFSSNVTVDNQAMGGRSTKSFIDEGRLNTIFNQIKKGDYLLIQFGHNDQKIEDSTRYTEPSGSYQVNLKMFISKAREKKAIPVLLSSISRRVFKAGQVDRSSLGNYPKAMEEVAKKEQVTFIDMNRLSADYLDQLGEEKSKDLFLHLSKNEYPNYPNGLEDNTHLSESGGFTFARVVAVELKKHFVHLNQETFPVEEAYS